MGYIHDRCLQVLQYRWDFIQWKNITYATLETTHYERFKTVT